jgi:predicted DNA-binding transcriptional regulator AlpA
VPDNLDDIRVLSKEQAIHTLGVSKRTFDRLAALGDLPTKTRLSANRIGYRVCDIKQWLDARREVVA